MTRSKHTKSLRHTKRKLFDRRCEFLSIKYSWNRRNPWPAFVVDDFDVFAAFAVFLGDFRRLRLWRHTHSLVLSTTWSSVIIGFTKVLMRCRSLCFETCCRFCYRFCCRFNVVFLMLSLSLSLFPPASLRAKIV